MESDPTESGPGIRDDGRRTQVLPDALYERAGIAAFHLRTNGTFTAVNDAFTALTGYERSDLLGEPLASFVDLEQADVAPLFESLRHESDSTGTIPILLETADGVTLLCNVHLQWLGRERDDATIVGIVERSPANSLPTAADVDLTYGKTFAALAEAVPDGIVVLDTKSDIRYANPAVERILGYPPEELVGASKLTMIPERLRRTHLEALARYLQTGEKHINWTYVELPGQHKDGHEVPLGVSLNDFTYRGDRYFVGLFRDISRRKEAERRLDEKITQLESVSELGKLALAIPDVDDLFEKANRLVAAGLDAAYANVLELRTLRNDLLLRAGFGWDDGQVGTATVSATDTDSQAGFTLDVDHPVVVEDHRTESRFSGPGLLTDHGVRSGISVTIGPATDPWGVLGVHDTTDREFADHDLDFVQSVATILATAIDRHRRESRLDETVSKLEESNERLEQFAYAASHDLQEPLRMVSSYLTLIEQRYGDELGEEAEEFLEFAVDGADRMREMIEGLLEYSRVETRGESFEPVDCEAVLEEVLADLSVTIAEQDAEITVDTLPTVLADRSQLRQVFQNLVSNALKYSGGRPRVHVGVDRTGQEWVFSISDEGVGIDPGDQDRIFEVFQRLHGRDEHAGTGIGLALCARIVERHGGRIWVDSERGEGSTFFFTIPETDDHRVDTQLETGGLER